MAPDSGAISALDATSPAVDGGTSLLACVWGRVTEACLCGGARVAEGHCCGGLAQAAECPALESADYYVSPTGDDASPGDLDHPFRSFEKAHSVAEAGDLIYFRGGVYHPKSATAGWNNLRHRHGAAGHAVRFWAYPGERVVFDFSTMQASGDSLMGIHFVGNYWHWRGIEIANTPQYPSSPMSFGFVVRDSSHNIFENMKFYGHAGRGFVLVGGSTDNLVLNCDAYENADPLDGYEHADGFGSQTSTGTTNTFRGCRAWHNADDGYDHFDNLGTVVHDGCWAFWNGFLKDGTLAGNGQGFKFGRSVSAQGKVTRVARRCLAFGNGEWGFDQNNLADPIELLHCTSHRNAQGINLHSNDRIHTVRNCISFGNGSNDIWVNATSNNDHNSWNGGVTVTATDFLSVDWTGMDGPRAADGSLPDRDYLQLAADSDLVDQGVDVGLPYHGTAPDLGAYER